MKNKLWFKVLIVLIGIVAMFFLVNNFVYADDVVGSQAIERYNVGIGNVNTDEKSPTDVADSLVGSIIYALQIAFLALAIIMAMVLGIKYMASSVNEKAEIKKHLSVYILGVVLLFAASGIVALLRKIFVNISKI